MKKILVLFAAIVLVGVVSNPVMAQKKKKVTALEKELTLITETVDLEPGEVEQVKVILKKFNVNKKEAFKKAGDDKEARKKLMTPLYKERSQALIKVMGKENYKKYRAAAKAKRKKEKA